MTSKEVTKSETGKEIEKELNSVARSAHRYPSCKVAVWCRRVVETYSVWLYV